MLLLDTLKRLDAYPKISLDDRDFRNKTVFGAAITLFSVMLMISLIIGELGTYMKPQVSEDLFVDTTRSHKLKINLDVYLPSISCQYLSLDAMDSAGDQHLHIEHNIFKRRFDLSGEPIDEATKEDIATTTKKKVDTTTDAANATVAAVVCGSCYGAAHNNTHCCQTCSDVIDAYRAKRWTPDTANFEQCVREGRVDPDGEKLALKEGCKIYGHLEVNRMSGSFHVAPGKSFSMNHMHVHDVHPYTSGAFNTTHHIKHLSFGERLDYANTHPLDLTENVAMEGATMFQYYIKIVPTMYVKINGDVINTNQFSVTRHVRVVTPFGSDSGMPGVFFSYELSPLMVKYTESQRSLFHLVTAICAIVGGIFTVAGIVDTVVYKSLHAIQKKIELGKFS